MRWRRGRMAEDGGRPRAPSLTHGAAPAQRGGAEARGEAWRGELSRCCDVTAPPDLGARRCLETRRRRGDEADNGGSCGTGSARGPGTQRALSGVRLPQVRPSCPAGHHANASRQGRQGTVRTSAVRAQGPASRGGAERAQKPSRTWAASRDSLISICRLVF